MSSPEEVMGHQRVAGILLSLGSDERAAILRNMKPDLVGRVADAMVELDPRLRAEGAIDELYAELARAINGPKSIRPCEAEELTDLLGAVFGPQRAQTMLNEITERRRERRPFLALESYRPYEIARVLREDSPTVAAVVLAHLDPAASAGILRFFEDEAAIDLVRRMATLEPPNVEVLRTIATDLVEQIESAPVAAAIPEHGSRLKAIAELLSNAPPIIEKGVIDSIAEVDAEMASELRECMFTWEDIATIDKRTMQKILSTVNTKTLSIALKGCSNDVEENVLGNLSARVRAMVKEERDLAGAMPMSAVHGARDEIMTNIRGMIEAGEFRPNRGGDELVS